MSVYISHHFCCTVGTCSYQHVLVPEIRFFTFRYIETDVCILTRKFSPVESCYPQLHAVGCTGIRLQRCAHAQEAVVTIATHYFLIPDLVPSLGTKWRRGAAGC